MSTSSTEKTAPKQEFSFSTEFEAQLPPKGPRLNYAPIPGRAGEERAAGGNNSSAMGTTLSTYPPLGQVTQLASGDVTFYAVLETTEQTRASDWQVALWHSTGSPSSPQWTEAVLVPLPARDGPAGGVDGSGSVWSLQAPAEPAVVRHLYRAKLAVGSPFHFTAKFRRTPASAADTAWCWARDNQQMDDGTVVVNPRTGEAWLGEQCLSPDQQSEEGRESLADLVQGLSPAFRVTSPMSECPETQLWALRVAVPGADAARDVSTWTHVDVGRPWGASGGFLRWMALVRIWTPWLAPRHGKERLRLDKDAVLCAFLNGEGRHLVFLAVSGVDHLASVFQSDDDGKLVLSVRSDSAREETATVLVAVGDSFEGANAAAMYHARGLVRPMSEGVAAALGSIPEDPSRSSMLGITTETTTETVTGAAPGPATGTTAETISGPVSGSESAPIHAQWLQNWYDGLGYCTWNALGQGLTEDKVFSALATLAKNKINITSLILDDNWQSIDRSSGQGQFQYGWTAFEADTQQFPHGLAHAVAGARARQPSIRHVAVWHALLGYWGGIAPAGEIARAYKTVSVDRDHPERRHLPIAGPMTVVDEPDVGALYNDFYRFLVAAGVDGVKTDAQFMMDTWASASVRRRLTTAYQDAWTIATLRHFSYRALSCMSQTPPILFHSQMPRNRPALLVRNSDDFFPGVPASHPWHVWANAHNSLFTQHLNVLPDWDMFQTVHDYSGFHAAARSLSGGPIYITDVPGQHNLELIRQLSGATTFGQTVIFRPSVVGRALHPYTGYHDKALLRLGSYHGNASSGAGLLGLFNVSDAPLTELVPLARVPGVRSGPLYVARVHSTGHVTSQPVGMEADTLFAVSLGVRGHEIITAYPVLPFRGRASSDTLHVANLGLVDKMAAAATIVRTESTQRQPTGESESGDSRIELILSFKALGTVGLYVSALLSLPVADHFLATIQGHVIPPHCAVVSKQSEHVLEIDTARAWSEMGLQPKMNNDLVLTVYIT